MQALCRLYEGSLRLLKAACVYRGTDVWRWCGKILGVHMCGDAAGEVIQLAGVCIKAGATKEHFDR